MRKLQLRRVGDHASLTQTGKGKKLRRPYVKGKKPKKGGKR